MAIKTPKIKRETKISVMSEFDSNTTAKIKTTISNVASDTAIQNIQQSLGVNALPPNAREYVKKSVTDVTEQRTNQIINQLSDNKITSSQRTGTVIEVTGRVSGTTLNAMAKSTIDVKVHTAMKSAISIGEEIASNIVTALKTEHSIITQSDGIGNIISGSTNVGNVIYEHGMIILTSGSFINNFITTPNLTCSFESTVTIYESQYKCTLRQNEFNFSQNPTLISGSSNSGKIYDFATGSYFDPYVTTIGLYNNNYELLAVAKLSQPLPLSSVTDTSILVNLDL
jgi:hypothetical protein